MLLALICSLDSNVIVLMADRTYTTGVRPSLTKPRKRRASSVIL